MAISANLSPWDCKVIHAYLFFLTSLIAWVKKKKKSNIPSFLTSFLSLFNFLRSSRDIFGKLLALAWSQCTWSPRMHTCIFGLGTKRNLDKRIIKFIFKNRILSWITIIVINKVSYESLRLYLLANGFSTIIQPNVILKKTLSKSLVDCSSLKLPDQWPLNPHVSSHCNFLIDLTTKNSTKTKWFQY